MDIKPNNLILHCYAEQKDNQWSAFCLELTLAAQGDTFEEAKKKLSSMIRTYIYDATVGQDKEYADQLLSRRAPFFEWIKFYLIVFKYKIHLAKNGKLFNCSMPLIPAKV